MTQVSQRPSVLFQESLSWGTQVYYLLEGWEHFQFSQVILGCKKSGENGSKHLNQCLNSKR